MSTPPSTASKPPRPPDQQDTIEQLLDASGLRDGVPIRKTFVQQGTGKATTPGPLAPLVERKDVTALDLYLLAHAKASGGDWAVALPAATWARAMGREATDTSLSFISKVWRRLVDAKLISRTRSGRNANVTLLCEDGSGKPYTRPLTKDDDRWFTLSYAYWRDRWHEKLGLPAKAMLLVALSEKNGFTLPFDFAPAWYGISRNTAQRGMAELAEHGLIAKEELWEKWLRSPTGWRTVIKYTLCPPFGPHPPKRQKEVKPPPSPPADGVSEFGRALNAIFQTGAQPKNRPKGAATKNRP